jgi:hypothetical protein
MEAMILGYPPEQAGQISVTATKEEWLEVIEKSKWIPDSALRDDGFSQLVYWLINQGVYE